MSVREAYSYTVLRYVHDVMTGEFINVGVVLHGETGVKCRFLTNHGRAAKFFADLDKSAFKAALSDVAAGIKLVSLQDHNAGFLKQQPDALLIAHRALIADDSSFQWSPAGSGLSKDIDATVEHLFKRLVLNHVSGKTAQRKQDSDVWRPIRLRLQEMNIDNRFETQTFSGSDDEITFEHTWKNSHWHAIEPISFDLADANEIKSKAHKLRGHFESVADAIKEQVSLNLVLAPPTDPKLEQAFARARSILERSTNQPKIYNEANVDQLVADLADKIHAHDREEFSAI